MKKKTKNNKKDKNSQKGKRGKKREESIACGKEFEISIERR